MNLCFGPDYKADEEDGIKFLSSFKCFKIPTLDNIKTIIEELPTRS
jgi:hypothetical protein